ncbi:hypothetical protein BH24ACT20_BH24ACT20_00730 [soil metagenome]|jgi:hypothetical protein
MLRTQVVGDTEAEGSLRRLETASVMLAEALDTPAIPDDGHRRATGHSVGERRYERQERPEAYEPLDVFYQVGGAGADEDPAPPGMGGG